MVGCQDSFVDPFRVATKSFKVELIQDGRIPYLDQQVNQVTFMATPKEVEHQPVNRAVFIPFPQRF